MMTEYPTEERYIVIHCAATRPDADITAEQIRRYHKSKGWRDIGYHKFIRRSGLVEDGRDMPGYGAHARGTTPFGPMNLVGIGVCLAGGLDEKGRPSGDHYTREQWIALRETVTNLMEVHRIPPDRVLGHRDVINDPAFQSPDGPKACPCFSVQDWMQRTGIAAPPPAPEPIEPGPVVVPTVHEVVAGDTYWRLSRNYGISLDILSALNPDFPILHPGDEVRLT